MKKQILLVEGDPSLRELLNAVLAQTGHALFAAADRWDGLRIVEQQRIDLAIVALVMPQEACIKTIRAIRREQPQMPIVAISGGIGYGPAGNFLGIGQDTGALRLLEEPFAYEELLLAVDELLAGALPAALRDPLRKIAGTT